MVVEKVTGDLLAADAEALVNAVNCAGVMGKGIALQFKRRFPEMFQDYVAACRRGDVHTGHMHLSRVGEPEGPQWIINFPTKRHWRSPSKLDYIETGLDDLVRVLTEHRIHSVAIPALGTGHGGLPWADVEPLILAELAVLDDVHVLLYPPADPGGSHRL